MNLSLLPIECWALIADNLSSHDLSLMACVSTSFYVVFGPFLYRYIDLSVHRSLPSTMEKDPGRISLRSPGLFGRQRSFANMILYHKPNYASWVRYFTWTMCLQPRHTGMPVPKDELESTVELFSRLDRVVFIDITGGDMHYYPPKMHYGLATAILHGPDKAPLKTLTINNVHECGHSRWGQNHQEPPIREDYQWGLAAWDDSDAEPIEEDWASGSLPQQVPPGPMRHLLNQDLVTRCTRLQSLTLCQVSLEMLHAYGLIPPGWYYPGPEIHEELPSFIRSVHPCHLEIQYDDFSMSLRSELKTLWRKNTCRGNLPYHQHFDQKLLPLLKEGWPQLRELELTCWLIADTDSFTELCTIRLQLVLEVVQM